MGNVGNEGHRSAKPVHGEDFHLKKVKTKVSK